MGIEEILGSATNLLKIENEHEQEIQRIISTTNDKIREREIQELSVKLNHQLKEEDLKLLCQRYKNMHEEQMLKNQFQHDENKIKLYNDYDLNLQKNYLDYKREEINIEEKRYKNIMDHEENNKKIDNEARKDFYSYNERLNETNKKFKVEEDKIFANYNILKQEKDNDRLNIDKKFESEKISMDYDYKKETEKAQRIFEQNKDINEKNFKIKMEQLNTDRQTELKKLDILEKLLTNPNMQNPLMIQMMMNQITPKAQVDQDNISPGPLPGKNTMNFNQLTFTKMTPQM